MVVVAVAVWREEREPQRKKRRSDHSVYTATTAGYLWSDYLQLKKKRNLKATRQSREGRGGKGKGTSFEDEVAILANILIHFMERDPCVINLPIRFLVILRHSGQEFNATKL